MVGHLVMSGVVGDDVGDGRCLIITQSHITIVYGYNRMLVV